MKQSTIVVNEFIPPCRKNNALGAFKNAHISTRKIEQCAFGCCIVYECTDCGRQFGTDQGHIKRRL